MSGIVSNVGLVSGLPIQDIINQLIAVESRPLVQMQARLQAVQVERAAFLDLGSRLLALKSAAGQLDTLALFRRTKAVSGDPAVFTATAADGAVPGSYAFRVQSLVSSHQLVSAGYNDPDRTPVGAGTIAIETGRGRLDHTTFLDDLNGSQGVGRGMIEVVDQAGHRAEIDLGAALTLDDVLEAINGDARIRVEATVAGDAIVLRDVSGGTGVLSVTDLGSGTIARDLAIAGSVQYAEGNLQSQILRGGDIRVVSGSTPLDSLNDGNGVRRNASGPDLTIALLDGGGSFDVVLNDRMAADGSTPLAMLNSGNGVRLGTFAVRTASGAEFTVDLTQARDFDGSGVARPVRTVADVFAAINEDTAGAVSARLQAGTDLIELVDQTSGAGGFEVKDLTGHAAGDLGLAGAGEAGRIVSPDLYRIATLGDVARSINYAAGNYDVASGTRIIEAEVSDQGNGLVLRRPGGGGFEVRSAGLETLGVSGAAEDLGLLGASTADGSGGEVLASRPLVAGLNTVLLRSLNGGRGVTPGELRITARDGSAIAVNLSGAATVQDVLNRINEHPAAAGKIRASLNASSNGLTLTDLTGADAAPLKVTDDGAVGSNGLGAAESLGLSGPGVFASQLQGANLQLQYVSENTRLDALPGGPAAGTGTLQITASDGSTFTVRISENQVTIGDVIRQINAQGADRGVTARINDRGDGIAVYDTTGGGGALTIIDTEGRVGRRLNLASAAQTQGDEQVIDGSFERHVVIDGDDTLQDVADKLNAAGAGVHATIINDGSDDGAYRLSVTSAVSGTAGRLMFDPGSSGLAVSTLVQPQDAVVFFGGADAANPIVLRSSTNALAGVIQGVTLDLVGTSDEPVDLTVSPDVDQLVETIGSFVDAYNAVIDRIDELTFFDAETLKGGVLRGDPTVRNVATRLNSMLSAAVPADDAGINRMTAVGLQFANGGHLEFDESRFREVFADNPEAVEELFTLSQTVEQTTTGADGSAQPVVDPATGAPATTFLGLGLGHRIEEALDLLTRSTDGVLARKDLNLQRQEDLFNERAEQLLARLESSRARLEAKFAGLERSLSGLNGQQSSLDALAAALSAGLFAGNA